MALPGISVPEALPYFLLDGYDVTLGDVYTSVSNGTGHSRTRPLYTAQQRRVDVSLLLDANQMSGLDVWFEDTLLQGSRSFSVRLPRLGLGYEWWAAAWAEPYQATPLLAESGIHWRVTGALILMGEPSDTPPPSIGLALEVGVSLDGQGQIIGTTALAVEFSLVLRKELLFAIEFALTLDDVQNGATPSDVDRDKRWIWMRYPYAAGRTSDVSDQSEFDQRSWFGL